MAPSVRMVRPMPSHIGTRIQEFRTAKEITQDQLAERVGVKGGQVSRWERGAVEPEAKYIVPLADALGVSADRLLRGSGDLPASLAEVVDRAVEFFGTALDDATIAWARDEVRSHGDVTALEWVARISRKLRGTTPSEAQKSETATFRKRGEELGVRRRSR